MTFFDLVKAVIPLILIVGLLYAVLYFIKKYGISIKGNKAGSVAINVLSSQMIMPKKFISVVKVDDKLLVLGVSEHSITLLKELDKPVQVNKAYAANDEKSNFLDLLKKNFGLK